MRISNSKIHGNVLIFKKLKEQVHHLDMFCYKATV